MINISSSKLPESNGNQSFAAFFKMTTNAPPYDCAESANQKLLYFIARTPPFYGKGGKGVSFELAPYLAAFEKCAVKLGMQASIP